MKNKKEPWIHVDMGETVLDRSRPRGAPESDFLLGQPATVAATSETAP